MPAIRKENSSGWGTYVIALGDHVFVGRTWDVYWIEGRSGRHQSFAVCPFLSVLWTDVSWIRVKYLRDFVKAGWVAQLIGQLSLSGNGLN